MRKVILSEAQFRRLIGETTSYLPNLMYAEEPECSSETDVSVSDKIDGFSTDTPTTDHIVDTMPNNRSGYWRRKGNHGLFEDNALNETNNSDLKGGLHGANRGKDITFSQQQLADLRKSLSAMEKTDTGYDFGMNILKNGGKVSYQAYQKHLTDMKNKGAKDMTPKSVRNAADNQKNTAETVSRSGRELNSSMGISNRKQKNPNTNNSGNYSFQYEN